MTVDDWFPFYIDIKGNEQFCFGRTTYSDIWSIMLEKAWAKICGSYEASEFGTALETFNNFDGIPCDEFIL